MDSSGEFALKAETMFYILLQQNIDNIVYDFQNFHLSQTSHQASLRLAYFQLTAHLWLLVTV